MCTQSAICISHPLLTVSLLSLMPRARERLEKDYHQKNVFPFQIASVYTALLVVFKTNQHMLKCGEKHENCGLSAPVFVYKYPFFDNLEIEMFSC